MRGWLIALLVLGCGDDAAVGAADGALPDAAIDGAMPSPDASPLPDCPCFAGDGTYCATAIGDYGQAHGCSAPGLDEHTGDLFTCSGGAWSIAMACPAGCYVAPAGQADACHVAGTTHNLWVVFGPSGIHRDLAGLFQCLLGRTNFNDLARGYPNGYGLAWGGAIDANCGMNAYACAVDALRAAGFTIGDHDLVEIVVHGYCGGDNNARADGLVASGVHIRGANIGDCPNAPAEEERVAVHEAFEASGDWANADCCTGEVSTSCPDQGESFCPDCPCSCGQFATDGSYGGYTLDCGGGHTYWSQRVPNAASGEFDPAACAPFTITN